MTLKNHIIIGGAASIVLYAFTGIEALWFFCASVLIDIDHYLDFIFHSRLRNLSPASMFSYHRTLQKWWKDPSFLNMEVFHTAEFLGILLFLTILLGSGTLLAIFLGFLFHIGLDMIFLLHHGVFSKRTNSIISYFLRKRQMVKSGLDPANLYRKAVETVS